MAKSVWPKSVSAVPMFLAMNNKTKRTLVLVPFIVDISWRKMSSRDLTATSLSMARMRARGPRPT